MTATTPIFKAATDRQVPRVGQADRGFASLETGKDPDVDISHFIARTWTSAASSQCSHASWAGRQSQPGTPHERGETRTPIAWLQCQRMDALVYEYVLPSWGGAPPAPTSQFGDVRRQSAQAIDGIARNGSPSFRATYGTPPKQPSLTQSVSDAIASGLAELTRLDTIVAEAESRLQEARAGLSTYRPEGSHQEDGFAVLLDTVVSDLRDRLGASRRVASTFNVAFFGRTGAGKSTLLSALGGLDGRLVSSDGQSDFTTDVQPLDWQGCRLYDTPGINGWGRSRPRPDLEEAAREAVEVADVVLLCFDSQSQQASEFVKVAAWIRDYRKPAIAVLNIRNPMWRHPARVASFALRQGLARTAQQHADNITSELEAIGLHDVPVVAIHSKRSLFARASTPFHGPAAPELESERSAYGLDYLDRMSNLPVLEGLMSACILEGAASLRLGALREGLQAGLRDWADEIDRLAEHHQDRGKTIEGTVAEWLGILGYPDPERRRSLRRDDHSPDYLEALEAARGEPFTAPASGRLEGYVRHLLKSHLHPHRSRSLSAAEQLIIDAFDGQVQVDEDEFESTVFDGNSIADAVETVGELAGDFLVENLDIARVDAVIDLDLIERSGTTISGGAGIGGRRAANMLKAGGLLSSGTGAVLGAVALTQWWNPAGWTAAAILGGLGIASAVLGFFGKRTRKRAEERRAETRARAVADARSSVNAYFDDYETQQLVKVINEAWTNASEPASRLFLEALHIRTGCARLHAEAAWLREQAAAQPPVASPAQVIREASERLLATATWHAPNLEALLLGEDWIHDNTELDASSRLTESDQHLLVRAGESDRTAFAALLVDTFVDSQVEPVRNWIESVTTSGALDQLAQEELEHAKELLHETPKIVILGDYSSGKTSLIKRLLAEAGEETPPSLQVDARSVTSKANRYRFGPLELVDAPGFQSGNDKHDTLALEASKEAAVTVVVLHVNLLIGDTSRLERLLLGDAAAVGKAARTIFVIGRTDEIGLDPIISPSEFIVRRHRKTEELLSILDSRGLHVERSHVLALAADPYGLVGNRETVTASDYSASNRIWDGANSLYSPLLELSESTVAGMSASAAFDFGRSALLGARLRAQTETDDLEEARASGERFEQLIETSLAELRLLQQSVESRVRRAVDDHANEVLSEALGAGPDKVDAMAKRLQFWWQDPRLGSAMTSLQPDIEGDLTDWSRRHASEFERAVRQLTFSVESEDYDGLGKAENAGIKDGVRVAGQVTKHTANMVKAAGTRDAVYTIVKAAGGKFKPWGAVKLGAKVAKAGAVLGVVAAAFDVLDWVLAARKEDDREAARRKAAEHVRRTKPLVVKDLLEQPEGPLEALRKFEVDITESLESLRDAAEERASSANEACQRLVALDALLDGGEELAH